MSSHRENTFYLELPYEVITRMAPIELPFNMHKQYEAYLEREKYLEVNILKMFKEREKYAANYIIIGEMIHVMFDKDLSFDDAYDYLRGSIGEMLQQVDEIFGELLEEKEAINLFEQLFQNILKMAKKRENNTLMEEDYDKAFLGLRDVGGKIVNILDYYGADCLVDEILTDEEVSQQVEKEYVKPIQDILKEYIDLVVEDEEEEYFSILSEIVVQSREFLAYQALLNIIIVDAINNGIRVSDSIKSYDREQMVDDCKKKILNCIGLGDYREEIEEVMKLLLEG